MLTSSHVGQKSKNQRKLQGTITPPSVGRGDPTEVVTGNKNAPGVAEDEDEGAEEEGGVVATSVAVVVASPSVAAIGCDVVLSVGRLWLLSLSSRTRVRSSAVADPSLVGALVAWSVTWSVAWVVFWLAVWSVVCLVASLVPSSVSIACRSVVFLPLGSIIFDGSSTVVGSVAAESPFESIVSPNSLTV